MQYPFAEHTSFPEDCPPNSTISDGQIFEDALFSQVYARHIIPTAHDHRRHLGTSTHKFLVPSPQSHSDATSTSSHSPTPAPANLSTPEFTVHRSWAQVMPPGNPDTTALNIYQHSPTSYPVRCRNCGKLHLGHPVHSSRCFVPEMKETTSIRQVSSPLPSQIQMLQSAIGDPLGANALINIPAHVPSFDRVSPSMMTEIPQRPYRSRRHRACSPGSISVARFTTANGNSFSLQSALGKKYTRLIERDETFAPGSLSIHIRIEWPGYGSSGHQIRARDWHRPPRPITYEKLITEVAKSFDRFIKEMQDKPIEIGYEQWRVGPTGSNFITIDRLYLKSLHRVTKSSWQAVVLCAPA